MAKCNVRDGKRSSIATMTTVREEIHQGLSLSCRLVNLLVTGLRDKTKKSHCDDGFNSTRMLENYNIIDTKSLVYFPL